MGSFGEKLRQQREQRGIALDAMSQTTKISTRMLRALEDEHFDQLPGGVFNKGFVRAYARQVGMDEEEAVSDYLAALRESQIQAQQILPDFRAPAGKPSQTAAPGDRPENRQKRDLQNRDLHNNELRHSDLPLNVSPGSDLHGGDGREHGSHEFRGEDRRKQGRRNDDRRNDDRRPEDLHSLPDSTTYVSAASSAQPAHEPSARIPWGRLAVALLLMTLALAFWNFRRHGQITAASRPAGASNQSPTPVLISPSSAPTQPPGSAAALKAGTASPAGTLTAGTSVGTNSAGTAPPTIRASTTQLAAPVLASSGKIPAASTTPPYTSGSATKPGANPSGAGSTPPVTKAAASAPAAKPPISFTLLIRAERTTWVSIAADGKPVAHETLIAPAHTSIRASREIVVKAGNAAGVSFLLNGKEFPAQGNEGEVKTYVFDATGFRVLPQTQVPSTNR